MEAATFSTQRLAATKLASLSRLMGVLAMVDEDYCSWRKGIGHDTALPGGLAPWMMAGVVHWGVVVRSSQAFSSEFCCMPSPV